MIRSDAPSRPTRSAIASGAASAGAASSSAEDLTLAEECAVDLDVLGAAEIAGERIFGEHHDVGDVPASREP